MDSTAGQGERRNFYGRVHGKTLRASQKDYLENDLEVLRLKGVTPAENPGRDALALDHHGELVYIAPTRVNLQLTQERWPEVRFTATREHGAR